MEIFEQLDCDLEGELYYNSSTQHQAVMRVYATDASVYQEIPMAVCLPKNTTDIKKLILFAGKNKLHLIPRAAGTSLAGQVVGSGIVVDISRHFNSVLEINIAEKWVRVQPGVIRDDLNALLKPYGLMFGPETSTSSRAMIGGMIGNNSCGLHSMIWGSTRDNLIETNALLADGSEIKFESTDLEILKLKRTGNALDNIIYDKLLSLLEKSENQKSIRGNFPKKEVLRRNSGYALDSLLDTLEDNAKINLSTIIAGSEGTLCFVTEAKLKLIPLPPKETGIVAIHFLTIKEALKANLIAVGHSCAASELVDHVILEQAFNNSAQLANRYFVEGQPGAILMVEFFEDLPAKLTLKCEKLIVDLKKAGLGYAYPVLVGKETAKAWDLRKAGLGLLRNLKGDIQPVNLIEDCAVSVNDLPDYIHDLEILLKRNDVRYSIYAHAGAGQLHVEPMINLKSVEGRLTFKRILAETSLLVKKYKGSLSGEHGDGRLRGEYISTVMGNEVYDLFKFVKSIFDPNGIFNIGKITDSPSMLSSLRYQIEHKPVSVPTIFDFSEQESMLRLTEKCSGSGDCRKTELTGGTMCPSYMVTRNEKDTTRARANMLRQFLTEPAISFKNEKTAVMVKDVLDLCLACKGCKIECPSSVDMTKLRAEFLYQYQQVNGLPLRSRLIGNFSKQMKLASFWPQLYNVVTQTVPVRKMINRISGFHPNRSLPALPKETLRTWYKKQVFPDRPTIKTVYLFCDEFTNYLDLVTGQKSIKLLHALGYQVVITEHADSGRALLSKGMLKEAKLCAEKNTKFFSSLVGPQTPLIGLEPSAILSFRDEYPDLVSTDLKLSAKNISKNTFLIEEFLSREIQNGQISASAFTTEHRKVVLHGHCHQKAMTDLQTSVKVLSLPVNYEVEVIPSGCCGMAGSFGYESEHYDLSMKAGSLVLFPYIQKQDKDVLIAAAGTSCRHQIKDGTQKSSFHPAEILFDALLNSNKL